MKKVILLLFAIILVFASCTDNTNEHEELIKSIQGIEKDKSTTDVGDGSDDHDMDED